MSLRERHLRNLPLEDEVLELPGVTGDESVTRVAAMCCGGEDTVSAVSYGTQESSSGSPPATIVSPSE